MGTRVAHSKRLQSSLLALLLCPSILIGQNGHAQETSKLAAVDGPLNQKGGWAGPFSAQGQQRDWMQAVHMTVLPNGKVLVVNGSSNRNRLDENGEFQEGVDVQEYDVVDNSYVFDPTTHGFQRIDSPPATRRVNDEDHPNDLFCAHQIHLYNGNVLFASGTADYYPNGDFKGNKLANIFAWKTGTWHAAGVMQDGHWYPTLLPLDDGRIAVFAGVSYEQFKISESVEFYDPFQSVENAWSHIDISEVPYSPFATRTSETNRRKDILDLYPRILPIPDGRFVITGHSSGGGELDSKNSYFVSFPSTRDSDEPRIVFTPGPKRSSVRRTYVSALNNPQNPFEILAVGGQKNSWIIDHGPGQQSIEGAKVTAHLDLLRAPTVQRGWAWDFHPTFLGDKPTDVRIMHYAVALPTKQILIIGGGNYSYYRPVLHPLLLTHDPSAPAGYRKEMMNPSKSPRLYHNTALLLPDGRVLLAGGNSHRATRDARTGKVDRTAYAPGVPPEPKIPSEVWDVEVFSPPYLFIPGLRPKITHAPEVINYGEEVTIRVDHLTKDGSLVMIRLPSVSHGMDLGQLMTDLDFEANLDAGVAKFTAPTNRHWNTPGYYMLFYLNAKGKPSEAAIVQLIPEERRFLTAASGRTKFVGWQDLPGVRAGSHSIADMNDKEFLVVAVVTNTCPKCEMYVDRWNEFAQECAQPNSRIGFVAINVAPAGSLMSGADAANDTLKAMREKAERLDIEFPYLLDSSQQVARKNKAEWVPTIFVLDKNREVVYSGQWDDHEAAEKVQTTYVAAALAALRAGKLPECSETRAYGCPIIYRK